MPNQNEGPKYTVEQIKNHIKNLSAMRDLKPEDYCEEGGLAHSLVQAKGFGKDDLKVTQLRKVFGARPKKRLNSTAHKFYPFCQLWLMRVAGS
jgi:hypothetical protein